MKRGRRKGLVRTTAHWYREDIPKMMEEVDQVFMTKFLDMPRRERRKWCKDNKVPFIVMPKISDNMNTRRWDKNKNYQIFEVKVDTENEKYPGEAKQKLARKWLRA